MHVSVRCYAELNDCLPPANRQREFVMTVAEGTTVQGLLSSLELRGVDLVLVNARSVGRGEVLFEGDRVSIYPVFDAIDIGDVSRISDRPERRARFVLDVHLGKLAHHLRMLGFDTVYRNRFEPDALLTIAREEDRILLSKSRTLVRGQEIQASYRVLSSDPREQLLEILRRFDLISLARPFTRCLHCNLLVQPVAKSTVVDRLPAKSREVYMDFTLCPGCQRLYWQGTHVERMNHFLEEIRVTVQRIICG